MGTLAEVHISPCPKCGENRWLMEVPSEVALGHGAGETPGISLARAVLVGFASAYAGVIGGVWRIAAFSRLINPRDDSPSVSLNAKMHRVRA